MDEILSGESTREIIKGKLREHFDGKIVRKDLTKKIKEGANVPVYVLEFLLGQYCSSDDEEVIEKGVENVKRILADNFVRPDEAQKIDRPPQHLRNRKRSSSLITGRSSSRQSVWRVKPTSIPMWRRFVTN